MKRVFLAVLVGALAVGNAVTLRAQESLGDVARENRKAKKPKAVRVYDNDNLPTSAPISTVGIAKAPSESTEKSKNAEEKASDQAATAETSDQTDKAEDRAKKQSAEAQARQKNQEQIKDDLEKQRAKVADVAHELDLLTREYRLRTALYYSDAGYRLRAPQLWAEEDQHYRDNIAAKEQELSTAKEKLADLEEAARKAGLSSKSVE